MKHVSTSRRSLLKFIGLTGGAVAIGGASFASKHFPISRTPLSGHGLLDEGPYTLGDLPYAFNALEPHIDAQTMQIHHDKHHAKYVSNLNEAIAKAPSLKDKKLEELLKDIKGLPDNVRTAIRNNGGGHYNHTFYWLILSPEKQEPSGKLADALTRDFGSMEEFKKQFKDAATKVFGSGWAWLVKNNDKLSIVTTPNQDNPIMDVAENKGTPLLGVDVWEHAYYLKYQNKRPDYLDAFWNVVNWKKVGEFYTS
jgi:superoxide dismutase, Fe-Mn family